MKQQQQWISMEQSSTDGVSGQLSTIGGWSGGGCFLLRWQYVPLSAARDLCQLAGTLMEGQTHLQDEGTPDSF